MFCCRNSILRLNRISRKIISNGTALKMQRLVLIALQNGRFRVHDVHHNTAMQMRFYNSVSHPRPARPVPSIGSDPHKIERYFAKMYYQLEDTHLNDLPVSDDIPNIGRYYHLNDVRLKAEMVHGKKAFAAMEVEVGLLRRRQQQPSQGSNWGLRQLWEVLWGGGSEKVVKIALAMNFADLCIKGTAYYLTGSKSLLAETMHSSLDLINQIVLLYGNMASVKQPNPDFPYGFGNMKYIGSLFAGFGIFSFGCGFSIYNGVHGLMYPGELESLSLGIFLLFGSLILQSVSCGRAFFEMRKRAMKERITLSQYFNSAGADPSLKVVLSEDVASIAGVGIAFTCVTLTHVFNYPALDSIGSILIGGVLGCAAWKIIQGNAAHLVGRSLPEEKRREICKFMTEDPIVRKMTDVKATYMSGNDFRFKAEIEYNGQEITRRYLQENCDVPAMYQQVKESKSQPEFEEFMMNHGDRLIDKVGDEVDRLEQKVREKYPEIRHMDLESS